MPYIPLTQFANLPQTTVTAGGTTAPVSGTTETWTVLSSGSFPAVELGAQQIHVADASTSYNSELITVTNISGNTWTVIRGAESTTPVSHLAGFTVIQVVSAGDFQSLQYPPWVFPVARYGAQGDGKIGTGGTGTAGTSTFTDAGASFVNAPAPQGDVNKVIIINQGTSGTGTAGGTAQNPFCGTITAVNSATSVTLSGLLAANCASAPYIYGTDDTSAINAAVTAAASFATSRNYKVQVAFQPLNYMLGSLTQQTSPVAYNTQIPVPYGTQYGQKMVIDFIGVGDATEPDFWESSVPSLQGTCLVSSLFATGQPNATYGTQSVIGGPSGSAGLGPGFFANVLVNVAGITVVCPWNSQQTGFDFRYCAQANFDSGSYLAFAPVNYNYSTNLVGGPYLSSVNLVTNGQSVGLGMPLTQNNDNCNIKYFTAEGCQTGITIAEHTTAQRLALIYCVTGILVNVPASVIHGASILYASVEASGTSLVGPVNAGSQFPLYIGMLDTEVIVTADISDPNNGLTGSVGWADFERTTMTVTGAAGLNILNYRLTPGPWSGAPAAPASGTAQRNTAFRPATIYASATTITGVSAGPSSGSLTSLGLTQASGGSAVAFKVPAGHWYSVTYTGTLTANWVLD